MSGLCAGQLREVLVTIFSTGDQSRFKGMPAEAEQTMVDWQLGISCVTSTGPQGAWRRGGTSLCVWGG